MANKTFQKEKIKIAAFDLDGTVLPAHEDIHEPVIEALKALQDAGVICTISSGRNVSQILDKVQAPFQYMVTSNGAEVRNIKTGEDIAAVAISPELLIQIAKLTKKNHGFAYLYQGDVITSFFDTHMYALRLMIRRAKKNDEKGRFLKACRREWRNMQNAMLLGNIYDWNFIRYAKNPKAPTFKAYLFVENPEDKEKLARALEELGGLEVLRMEGLSVEITMQGITKAWGLSKLAEHLGYTLENCIGFGDSCNDIEMLDSVGYAVAMGNAGDHVKPHADYVTDTCAKDGVAKFIQEYLL